MFTGTAGMGVGSKGSSSYMGIKGLENYGYAARADEAAEKILEQQYQTYKNVVPHTIWETYAPSANAPSTEYGNIVRVHMGQKRLGLGRVRNQRQHRPKRGHGFHLIL